MANPAHIIGTQWGIVDKSDAYQLLLNKTPSTRVLNPPGDRYPFKTTHVYIRYETDKTKEIKVVTQQRCLIQGNPPKEKPCYEMNKTLTNSNDICIQFFHSCDFTLDVYLDGKMKTITPEAGKVNEYTLLKLFPPLAHSDNRSGA